MQSALPCPISPTFEQQIEKTSSANCNAPRDLQLCSYEIFHEAVVVVKTVLQDDGHIMPVCWRSKYGIPQFPHPHGFSFFKNCVESSESKRISFPTLWWVRTFVHIVIL